jgi:hypothetical protein
MLRSFVVGAGNNFSPVARRDTLHLSETTWPQISHYQSCNYQNNTRIITRERRESQCINISVPAPKFIHDFDIKVVQLTTFLI